jgi:hypothetical protein
MRDPALAGHARPCHHISVNLRNLGHLALGFELDEVFVDNVNRIDKRRQEFGARDFFLYYISEERMVKFSVIIGEDQANIREGHGLSRVRYLTVIFSAPFA